MIYTLTLNPSVDYIVKLEGFQLGQLNRTIREAWGGENSVGAGDSMVAGFWLSI